jgi:hypothetical protein
MALNNIRSRLAVLYGNRAELETSVVDDRYVTRLHLPREVPASGHGARP